jgi:hypothetical protein
MKMKKKEKKKENRYKMIWQFNIHVVWETIALAVTQLFTSFPFATPLWEIAS